MHVDEHMGQAADPEILHRTSGFSETLALKNWVVSVASATVQCPPSPAWGLLPSGPHRGRQEDDCAGLPASGSQVWNRDPTERHSGLHQLPGMLATHGSTASSGKAGRPVKPPSQEWCTAAWAEDFHYASQQGSAFSLQTKASSLWNMQVCLLLWGALSDPKKGRQKKNLKIRQRTNITPIQVKVVKTEQTFKTLRIHLYFKYLKQDFRYGHGCSGKGGVLSCMELASHLGCIPTSFPCFQNMF